MSVGINDFWKLAVKSGVVTSDQAHALHRRFVEERKSGEGDRAAKNGDASQLAQWLIEGNVLSRYQARVLLKGVAGPFRFGDYRVADRFPDERFKQSFRAVHTPTGYPVVLRFYDAKLVPNENQWPRIAEAVEHFAQLKSPRIQHTYEWREEGNYRFAVVQDIEGQTLAKQLATAGPLSWELALRVVRQVAEALIEVATQGRAHGDIRPEMIWLSSHGCAFLLFEPIYWLAPQTLVASTPLDHLRLDYLAPELTVSGQTPDMQTDIYALGCTAYELLAGRPPFAAHEGAAKIECHVRQAPEPLDHQTVPEPVQHIVNRMMAKNPQVRFAKPQEVIEAINALLPTSDPLPIPSPSQAEYEASLSASAAPPASPPTPPPVVGDGVGESIPPVAEPTAGVADEASENRGDDGSHALTHVVVDDGPTVRSRGRRGRRRKPYALYVWIAVMLVGGGGALYFFYPTLVGQGVGESPETTGDRESPEKERGQPVAETKGGEAKSDDKSAGPLVVEDDGQTLWADPVAGQPISLAFVPPGVQLIVHLRPADLEAVEAETRFQAALGPRYDYYRKQFETLFHIPWTDVEQCLLSFSASNESFPRPALVVTLREAVDEAELVQRWGNPAAQAIGGKRAYPVANWMAYLPESQQGRVIVLATKEQLGEIIEFDGAPPVLLRQMTRLLAHTNDRHHVTILAVPAFLSNNLLRDDFTFYFGDPGKVRTALASILTDDVNAAVLSVAVTDPVYVELRMNIGSVPDPLASLKTVRDRIHKLSERVEDRLSSVTVPEYWRRVALRFPQMVRFVDEYVRANVEDRQLVFNAVLPRVAPANLLVGTEMLLMSGEATSTSAAKPPGKKTPADIHELLEARMTMMFDQQPLDFAIADLQAIVKDEYPDLKFPFEIRILGTDLQLGGITQNQQIVNFNEQDKKLSEILTSIVMKANPITTVKDPSEDDQKLVWVVGPDPDDPKRQIVLITTRDAAKTRNDTLPKVFQSKQ